MGGKRPDEFTLAEAACPFHSPGFAAVRVPSPSPFERQTRPLAAYLFDATGRHDGFSDMLERDWTRVMGRRPGTLRAESGRTTPRLMVQPGAPPRPLTGRAPNPLGPERLGGAGRVGEGWRASADVHEGRGPVAPTASSG